MQNANKAGQSATSNFAIKTKKSKKNGFTLVELALVLVLGGIVLSTVYNQFFDNKESTVSQDEAAATIQIAAKAQDKWSNQQDYTGVTETIMINNGVFPKWMVVGTGTQTVVNKVKGNVTCAPVNITGSMDGLECTTTNFSKNVCTAYIQKIASIMRRVSVGGTVVKAIDSTLNMGALGTSCSGTANSIAYVIPK